MPHPIILEVARVTIYYLHYLHYVQTGGAIVYIAHSCAGPRPTLATNTSNCGHTHSWKLATILSLRQQHYSFRSFLLIETNYGLRCTQKVYLLKFCCHQLPANTKYNSDFET